MRTIKRRIGEMIQVGDEVQLVIESIDGDMVQLGVNAPRDIRVRGVAEHQGKPPLAERQRSDETGKG